MQRVTYRGLTMDSIPVDEVVTGPTGGPRTPDDFAVRCPAGRAHCFFFRAGPELTGGPMVTTADLTLWGVGVRGLSIRVNGRLGLDLDGDETWPGIDPAMQLIEAYAEYAAAWPDVDGCARQPETARRRNAEAVHVLAEATLVGTYSLNPGAP